ncbi:hypothetical protein [Nesterenkonia haasae]|nr:hypothetical protein [Nesterenkonia haasae]
MTTRHHIPGIPFGMVASGNTEWTVDRLKSQYKSSRDLIATSS